MNKVLFLAATVFLAAGAAVFAASPEPIVITKNVRTNPELYFAGIPGDPEFSKEMTTFLGVCGWFDLSRNPKAEYILTGTLSGNRAIFTLTTGGAPAGSWGVTLSGSRRRLAQQTVDAIIQKNFKELKVKGFCSTKIAFCAQTASGVKNIYTCDIDGGDIQQITNYNALCVEPCWFPDGNSIGYSKYNRAGMDVIQTMLNPKRSRVLTSFRGINSGAAISPDGRNLAVILSPDHKVDLYVMPAGRGGVRRRLTSGISVEASPCWSPDGREIAFVSDETGVPKINIISIDGRNRRVLKALGSDAVTPDWSSDNKIVYATRIQGVYTIAVYDLKTGENTRITDEPGVWESPAWAADNRQVVCKRSDGRRSALYVIDSWTGRVRLLVSTPYNLSMPVWSRAGRR
ncbi:hypothetical protein [uncultured Victivallis sp.]|uniref:hypothetical protein n=1 Tax=uncultured Victivallis sp. TaxID=354118 RepID=UPI0025F63950|nr:hypothetical protein [uncultured Victivallis sp.]